MHWTLSNFVCLFRFFQLSVIVAGSCGGIRIEKVAAHLPIRRDRICHDCTIAADVLETQESKANKTIS